jgi:predicted metal-dependent phosphoesterase TrpH
MLADLHAHTFYSDGTLSPTQLLCRAAHNKLTHLAITDHDTTGAFDEIEHHPHPDNLQVLTGVEVSSLWEQQEIHIVGIGFNRHDTALQTLLKRQQQLRRNRAEAMDMQLQKAGITGLMGYLESLQCISISRNHIADYLMLQGIARSKEDAFKRLLGSRGKFSSPAQWCQIDEAIGAIRGAGGIAVLAHPNRYKISKHKLRRLVAEFAQARGEAMEVSYANLDPERMNQLAALCVGNSLWASTGSDFHSPAAQWMDLGRFRHLPAICTERAIWLHPAWPGTAKAIEPSVS